MKSRLKPPRAEKLGEASSCDAPTPVVKAREKRGPKVLPRTDRSVAKRPKKGTWVVYILFCADRTLYTGITNHLEHRLEMHNSGRGAKYTRGRLPVQILYFEKCPDHGAALRREYAIKRLSRQDKNVLIAEGPRRVRSRPS